MDTLLGSYVQVICAENPSQIGISGIVIYETDSRVNDSLVLLTENGCKRIQNCLLKVNNKYVWTVFRTNKLKALKRKYSII